MFEKSPIFASFAVDDAGKAKDFYTRVLDLKVSGVKDMPDMLEIKSPEGGSIFVYTKPDHKPADFTVLNIPVDDVDKAVDTLSAKGVQFEKYDRADIKTDQKGIARSDMVDIAWFKDPAGNILSVLHEN